MPQDRQGTCCQAGPFLEGKVEPHSEFRPRLSPAALRTLQTTLFPTFALDSSEAILR
jgi:hypothetical protein